MLLNILHALRLRLRLGLSRVFRRMSRQQRVTRYNNPQRVRLTQAEVAMLHSCAGHISPGQYARMAIMADLAAGPLDLSTITRLQTPNGKLDGVQTICFDAGSFAKLKRYAVKTGLERGTYARLALRHHLSQQHTSK